MNNQLHLKPHFVGLAAIVLLVGIPSFSARAEVLPNNIRIFPSNPPVTYELRHVVQPGFDHLFLISVFGNDPQYTFGGGGIAEYYSVHSASFGLEFTPSYVLGDAPLMSNYSNPFSFQLSLALGQSVLLAYWDDLRVINSTLNAPDEKDTYGWFQLTRTQAGLIVSDSATALGRGIIVGTYTQIPEPSSLAFMLTAIFGLMGKNRGDVLNGHTRLRTLEPRS